MALPSTAWQQGQSGNPSGRPKIDIHIRLLARKQTKKAIDTLIECLAAKDPKARIAAAVALLDRGWGRPAQGIELSGRDGDPLSAVLVFIPDNSRGDRQEGEQ